MFLASFKLNTAHVVNGLKSRTETQETQVLLSIQAWGSLGPGRSCNVPPQRRRDCGYPGISRETCQRRGCCFDNRIRGVKWCFHQEINCGYPYISAQECYNKGCCFDSSIAGTIWCFFPGSGDCHTICPLAFEDLH
uniref:P-type domain-containing protein n=1 Tax=Varanus komodoensis TaxID=61221 RepID=A0A8D2LFX5_VARKO